MSAAELIALKRRIKSVTNTKKITKAMGLVAASRLKKLRNRLQAMEQYYSKYSEIVEELFACCEEAGIYSSRNGSVKKLHIVITSDMGLSGGFNQNILNRVIEDINKENSVIIVVGHKGRNFFNKLKYHITAEYLDLPDFLGAAETREIAKKAMEMYVNKEVGEINIAFTRFISTVKQEIEIRKVLPLEVKKRNFLRDNIIFEPSLADIIESTMPAYISETILYSMLNSKTSENNARMSAMNGATKSADDILDRLKSKYSRIRQSAITQEISEIVGGSEAQR